MSLTQPENDDAGFFAQNADQSPLTADRARELVERFKADNGVLLKVKAIKNLEDLEDLISKAAANGNFRVYVPRDRSSFVESQAYEEALTLLKQKGFSVLEGPSMSTISWYYPVPNR